MEKTCIEHGKNVQFGPMKISQGILGDLLYIKIKDLKKQVSFMSSKCFQQIFYVTSCKKYFKAICGVVNVENSDRKLKLQF